MLKITTVRYAVNITSLVVHMLAVFTLQKAQADAVALSIYSFIIGLYVGDCNSLNFYRRNTNLENNYLLLERSVICCCAYILISGLNLSLIGPVYHIGICVGLFLPQGLISASNTFSKIILSAGIFKIILSGLVALAPISDLFLIQVLLCLSTSSIYLSTLYLIITNHNFRSSLIFTSKFSLACYLDFLYAAIISTPIQLYTSIGALVYGSYNTNPQLGLFYQTERLVRGLGATVIVIQASTMAFISNPSSAKIALGKTYNLLARYTLYGLLIGILFSSAGQIILKMLQINLFTLSSINVLLICLSTIAMYQSNLIGIQFLSVYRFTFYFLVSVTVGAFAFLTLNRAVSDPLILIAGSEFFVALSQILVIFMMRYNKISLTKKLERKIKL